MQPTRYSARLSSGADYDVEYFPFSLSYAFTLSADSPSTSSMPHLRTPSGSSLSHPTKLSQPLPQNLFIGLTFEIHTSIAL